MAVDFSVLNAASLTEFGESYTYTPDGGPSSTITAILESGDDLELENPGVQHSLWIRLSDFTSVPADGGQVRISGDDYKIVEVRKDGNGGVYLDLHLLRS